MAFTTIFFFDAPGSEDSETTLALAWTIWTYPAWVIPGCGLAWLAYSRKAYRWALGFCALPAIGALIIVVAGIVFEVRCAGQFACP